MHGPALLVSFAGLAIASAILPAQQAAAAPGDRNLRFAWPVPCSVQVSEVHEKRGKVFSARYRIELQRAEADAELLVSKRDYRLVAVDGKDVSGPTFRAQLAPLEAQMGILPDLRIATDGRVLGIEDWDRCYARVESLVRDLGKDDRAKAAVAGVLEMMRQPSGQGLMQMRAAEFWQVWVAGWVERDFGAAAELEEVGEFPVPGGAVVKAPLQIRHAGPEPGRDGHVRVTMRSHLHGDEVTNALIGSLREIARSTPGAPPVPDDAITAVDIVNDIWVVVRPDTMQPAEAVAEKRTTVTGQGSTRKDVERRHYTFDWGK